MDWLCYERFNYLPKLGKKCDLTLFYSSTVNSVMHGTSDASEVSLEREKVAFIDDILMTLQSSVSIPLE